MYFIVFPILDQVYHLDYYNEAAKQKKLNVHLFRHFICSHSFSLFVEFFSTMQPHFCFVQRNNNS